MIGCHGLVWTGTFDEQGLARAVDHTLTAGFDLLEIPLLNPYGFDLAGAQRVLARQPVTIAASLGLGEDSDISSADRRRCGQASNCWAKPWRCSAISARST
jgi:D-psicose/D-tagatose/L-ribulose 3-epimerase